MEYAGFWRRFVAFIIDYIIVLIPLKIIQAVFFPINNLPSNDQMLATGAIFHSIAMINIIGTIINWLYFALMESSNKQATLGKMVMGIYVTDLEGNRIGFARATGRYFAKLISALILCIGFMMAGWTKKKQALHDMIAGTLVLRK
ncbi:RDD family protein [Aceticella autotrophica]|uniref:RDD family protein n=1 Tax=Aceticella autotrophica TaxID=2755338 RepID=A0A975GAL9_9THEO|nr:RDD family protein [Aceticella autotrophica]QSZ27609.1 RDD family protein [Aceticella autotrophica]